MERAKKAQQIVLLTKAAERLKSERVVKETAAISTASIGGIGNISPMMLVVVAVGGIALISLNKSESKR